MVDDKENEVQVLPGIYMTAYKKSSINRKCENALQNKMLEEFLLSNDLGWLRFEQGKLRHSILLLEDSNNQLIEIMNEDIPLYSQVS